MSERKKIENKVVKDLTKFVKRALDASEQAWAYAHRVNEDHAQQEELFRELASKTSAAMDSLRKAGLDLGRYMVEMMEKEKKE